jgi:uncharacterized protein (TIGR03085 family)
MAMSERERHAMVQTLRHADPDASTLCEGWTVRHLVAHLVQRDQLPLEFFVDQAQSRPAGHERYLPRLVEESAGEAGYQGLVDRFASGAPAWSPVRWGGDAGNLLEFVVHHEDVRRGGPDPVPSRELPLDLEQAVWRQLRRATPLGLMTRTEGVVLAPPGRTPFTARRGPAPAIVQGEPVELALWFAGRREAARVTTFSAEGHDPGSS